jgi:hypothetical protein
MAFHGIAIALNAQQNSQLFSGRIYSVCRTRELGLSDREAYGRRLCLTRASSQESIRPEPQREQRRRGRHHFPAGQE